VGQTASWVAKLAPPDCQVSGTTRDATKQSTLLQSGIEPIVVSSASHAIDGFATKLVAAAANSNVLVSFPPDERSDEQLAKMCSRAKSIIYISSTGVYGIRSGKIDESTAVDDSSESSRSRLLAEKIWLDAGACVLRAPALYDCQSGLHKRLLAGSYRIPGNGENFVSRIHLKDLARIVWASFQKPLPPGSVFVVGDLQPATHVEVATWLCEQLKLDLPDSAPLNAVSPTLRNNRQICSDKILQELKIDLEFPTYKEGYRDCLKSA